MMKQIIEQIRVMLYIFCIIIFMGWQLSLFGKSLNEDYKIKQRQERMSFIKDSLEVEYFKLKIDSSKNGK